MAQLTADRYHVNPDTGRLNICRPIQTGVCGLKKQGEPEPPHYATKEEARVSWEENATVKYGATKTLTKSRRKKGSKDATTYRNNGKIATTQFVTPDHLARLLTHTVEPFDPVKIQPVAMSAVDEDGHEYINPITFDKPLGGLWFSGQEKTAVEVYGERAGTYWDSIIGDEEKLLPNNYEATIHKDAGIVQITDRESYAELLNHYGYIPAERYGVEPDDFFYKYAIKRKVDWEKFAEDYDGIYISWGAISANHAYAQDDDFMQENAGLDMWDIETLWICNPDAIDVKEY